MFFVCDGCCCDCLGGHESFVGVEKKESTCARSMGFGVIGFCFKMSDMRVVRL